ncbi:MAG: hypothetical protein N2170_08725, partial [Bacteroidia bacterium]|nr:hypothetical protein [Bacteroidia bacterium]
MRYLSRFTLSVTLTLLGKLGWAQPLSGTYTITGVSNFASNQFATIQEAFDSLNQRGAFNIVTIMLSPGTSWSPASEPNVITLAGYACTQCQVSLILDTTLTLAKSPGTAAGQRFVFRFGGNTQSTLSTVNNPGQLTGFTLDGRGKFTVQSTATGATTTGVIGIVSTTTSPLVVSRFTIRGLRLIGNGRANTFSGIYLGPDASLLSGGLQAGSNINILTLSGNTIDEVNRPIHARGARSILQNLTITNNRIGTSGAQSWAATVTIGGIHILGAQNITLSQNVITGAETTGSIYQVAGIRLDSCESFSITRNWIYGIRYVGNGGWGEYGIFINLPSSYLGTPAQTIANNMIADILGDAWPSTAGTGFVSGIFVTATATLANARINLYHNSIHLFGNNTNSSYTGGGSTAIGIGSNVTGGVNISGNILQNTLRTSQATDKVAYGIVFFSTSAPTSVNINYNAYRIQATGATNYIGRAGGTDYSTFSAWQGAPFTPEANGLELFFPAPFLSNIDLHLDPTNATRVVNAASSAFNGTQDFDGETRPLPNPGPGVNGDPGTAPDIGADELDGTPFVCPSALDADAISVTPDPATAGQNITVSVANSANLTGILSLRWSTNGTSWTTVSVLPSQFPYTIAAPSAPSFPTPFYVELIAGSIPGCPPLAPDTARDTIDILCPPTPTAGTLSAAPDTVLFGQAVTVSAAGASAPQYTLQWSTNGGSTWTN